MASKPVVSPDAARQTDWEANDQSLLVATLSATPAQRLAWLEEALRLAYASGALKWRKPDQDDEEGGS
jgi:hypothetical protein